MRHSIRNTTNEYVVGIDEVGRGALAGPVTVAAVAVPGDLRLTTNDLRLGKLRDSKKLSKEQREAWAVYFANHPALCYSIARVYPRQIEKMNISAAANLAALRAFNRLVSRFTMHASRFTVYLDGGLYLGNHRSGPTRKSGMVEAEKRGKRNIRANPLLKNKKYPRISVSTVVRGDEKIKAVSAASIIAKVHRDRAMVRLAKQYPQHGFEMHKGYGTRAHFAAIRKFGPCGAHRRTFDPVARMS